MFNFLNHVVFGTVLLNFRDSVTPFLEQCYAFLGQCYALFGTVLRPFWDSVTPFLGQCYALIYLFFGQSNNDYADMQLLNSIQLIFVLLLL